MNEHELFMKQAFDLSLKSKGLTSPNPMVGCLIVDSKKCHW